MAGPILSSLLLLQMKLLLTPHGTPRRTKGDSGHHHCRMCHSRPSLRGCYGDPTRQVFPKPMVHTFSGKPS